MNDQSKTYFNFETISMLKHSLFYISDSHLQTSMWGKQKYQTFKEPLEPRNLINIIKLP
jgi:hypothetical protein